MSDTKDHGENFLQRWSRRKRAAEAAARDGSEPLSREVSDADAAPKTTAQGPVDIAAFDPATLPPIELITATSDIRAYLAPGVPEELKRAALRRVWVTDPAIRDFVGVAENQWDFNKPDSIAGFGSLNFTPELSRMVAGLFSDASVQTAPQRPGQTERREHVQAPEISAELPPSAVAPALRESDAKPPQSTPSTEDVHANSVQYQRQDRAPDGTS